MADDRTYIRVHDGLDEHPKIEPLSDAAFRLLLRSWFYCSRNLTDGRISESAWKRRGSARARRELIDAGMVEQHDGHVQMHDYLDWQRSAAEVAEIKAARGAGGQLGNHIRWHVKRRQVDPTCEFCVANGSQDRSDSRSQDRSLSDRSPIANGSHSHKQRQIQNQEIFEGGSHVSSAAHEPPPLPDRCSRHAHTAEPGNCGGCADVRKANAVKPTLTVVPPNYCLVHDETFTRICRGCRSDRIARDEETA